MPFLTTKLTTRLGAFDGDFLHLELAQFPPQLAPSGHRAGNLVVVAVQAQTLVSRICQKRLPTSSILNGLIREVFDLSGGWVASDVDGKNTLTMLPYLKTLKRMPPPSGI
ncbi:MAG: hypothetical protein R3F19_26775 [Verrucomicrobiales bacterium]